MPTPQPTTPSKAAETAPITVLLTIEQLAQLDEVSAVIRRNSGRAVSRSALLRAISAAVLTSWGRSVLRGIVAMIRCVMRRSGLDQSNGYEAIASKFIRGRKHSDVGSAVVAEWSRLLPAGGSVLDIGCGSGVPISETLIARGFKVYGLDASATMVVAFRERFPSVLVECSSVEDATFLDRSYDGVVSWGLFFLLDADAQRRLIAKIAKALPVSGQLLFTSPWQICSWADAMTGQKSISLGRDGYRQALESESLVLVDERADEGESHYFFAAKK